MAADLNILHEIHSLDLFILYENDSLFIKYKDGTSLELSPCGSSFLHREAAPSNRVMKQFTRFAVSSFREKIIEAVKTRNLFAARPYLCKELIGQQELQVLRYHTHDPCLCLAFYFQGKRTFFGLHWATALKIRTPRPHPLFEE